MLLSLVSILAMTSTSTSTASSSSSGGISKPVSSVCTICNEMFSSKTNLFKHLRSAHPVMQSATGLSFRSVKDDVAIFPTRISVVDEDTVWWRVILKPQGIATNGGSGERLINSKDMLFAGAIESNACYKKAVPCHRLDKPTGGLVVCSKNRFGERLLFSSFRDRKVHKRYRAIVPGKLEASSGTIEEPVDGKSALTRYEVVQCTRSKIYGFLTTLDLYPVTGRQHQLRRHLQSIGHSILGDDRYVQKDNKFPQCDGYFAEVLFLWSLEVSFPSPHDMFQIITGARYGEDQTQTQLVHKMWGVDMTEAQIAAAYDSCKRVTVKIDEPLYFNTFRQMHEDEYNRQNQID